MAAGKILATVFITILVVIVAGGFYRLWDEDVIQPVKDDHWEEDNDALDLMDIEHNILSIVIFFICLFAAIVGAVEHKRRSTY